MLRWNTHEKEIQNGTKYIGQWTTDKFKSTWQGLGIIKFEDGSRYVGQTEGGTLEGRGHMVHSDGIVYHGDYKKGQANGKGTLWDPTGIQYEGTWKNDEYHGKGEELLNFGKITYKGDFLMGRKTGKAVLTFENDGNINKYEGDFVDGQFEGKGTYTWPEEKVYTGQFSANKMHGIGKT